MSTNYFERWSNMNKRELVKSPVYKRLTEKAREKAGNTTLGILNFLRTEVFPLRYPTLEDFVFNQLYRIFQAADHAVKHFTTKNLVLTNANCRTIGSHDIVSFVNVVAVWQNTEALGISKFIPIYCHAKPDIPWQGFFQTSVYQAALLSRLHYIDYGEYLPISMSITLSPEKNNHHAVVILMLPNNKDLYWNAIIIDTSSVTSDDKKMKTLFGEVKRKFKAAWKRFLGDKQKYQHDVITDLDFTRLYLDQTTLTSCVRDFQQDDPTCGYWSYGLLLSFLHAFQKDPALLSDKQSMTFWCKAFESHVTSPEKFEEYWNQLLSLMTTMQQYVKYTVYDTILATYPSWNIPSNIVSPQMTVDFLNIMRHTVPDPGAKNILKKINHLLDQSNLFWDVDLTTMHKRKTKQKDYTNARVKIEPESPESPEKQRKTEQNKYKKKTTVRALSPPLQLLFSSPPSPKTSLDWSWLKSKKRREKQPFAYTEDHPPHPKKYPQFYIETLINHKK